MKDKNTNGKEQPGRRCYPFFFAVFLHSSDFIHTFAAGNKQKRLL